MSSPREVVLLGSTGSIGTQALDVIARNPDRFRVVGLAAAGGRLDLLADQVIAHQPEIVAISDPVAAKEFADILTRLPDRAATAMGTPILLSGPEAATELAAGPCDVVLNGMTGSIGLLPTLAALRAGSTLALANKESLIVGGPLVRAAAGPGQIVPVDSEHSALAQCLLGNDPAAVARLILTASGGPFRGRARAELDDVTPDQALAHPTWSMGPVVTINSATLVNKGLELIEAHLLFDLPMDRIDVVVHPQSVVHSMVEYVDGSTMVQASPPDMRLPIALGLSWPKRIPGVAPSCDWSTATSWTFEPLDHHAFPAVALARHVGELGDCAPAVFNAANEECVAAFLDGRLPFPGIVATIEKVVGEHADGAARAAGNPLTVDDVLAAEEWARIRAREITGTAGTEGRR